MMGGVHGVDIAKIWMKGPLCQHRTASLFVLPPAHDSQTTLKQSVWISLALGNTFLKAASSFLFVPGLWWAGEGMAANSPNAGASPWPWAQPWPWVPGKRAIPEHLSMENQEAGAGLMRMWGQKLHSALGMLQINLPVSDMALCRVGAHLREHLRHSSSG